MEVQKAKPQFWEYVIPAVASLIGGVLSNRGQSSANQQNQQLTQENRDWMERMSGTSYQRAVTDMEAAGLNPMLAYQQGGASTPTSAAPVMQNTLGAGVQGTAATAQHAVGLMQGVQQVKQSQAQSDLFAASAAKARSETMERDLNSAKLAEEIGLLTAKKGESKMETRRIEEDVPGTRARAQKAFLEKEVSRESFSADVARRRAESLLSELEVPRMRNEAAFETTDMGKMNPQLRQILQLFRGAASARGAFGR